MVATSPDRPFIEAVIYSPLGEVRVWIETPPDAADPAAFASNPVRTSLRLDYQGGRDDALAHAGLARVAAHLNEALRGLNGGRPLRAVAEAPIALWLADRAIVTPGARTLARDLYADYTAWCLAAGGQPMSQRAFGDALRDRQMGVAGKSSDGLQYRGGVTLRTPPAAGGDQPQLRAV